MNESDPRSNVHYLGSSENKVFIRSSNIRLSYILNHLLKTDHKLKVLIVHVCFSFFKPL